MWVRYKDDGIPTKLIVHFAPAEPISQSVSPSHLNTGRSENNLRLWKVMAEQLKILFPEDDGADTFVVLALDAHSQVIGINESK